MQLATGQVIYNRYRVVKLLGQGGMGSVYRAWDLSLKRPVALKEMLPDPTMPRDQLKMLRDQFSKEAQVLSGMNHPSLPRVSDFFDWNGNTYLVMDFIEGKNLADIIVESHSVPESQVLIWLKQLLGALMVCHQNGVVHRDIKPQNIIVTPEGRAVLVDFGLVKLWDPKKPKTQQIIQKMGTREYSPPEQFGMNKNVHTQPNSDIFSLAATLYHALVGDVPLSAVERLVNQVNLTPPTQMGVPLQPHVETALLQALALSPNERFKDAQTMHIAVFGVESVAGGGVPSYGSSADTGQTRYSSGEYQPVNPTRKLSGASWKRQMGTGIVMAIAVALAVQIPMWGNARGGDFFILSISASIVGALGWFIGDLIFQAMTQPASSQDNQAVHSPTQKLVFSTRKLMRKLSTAQQVGLFAFIGLFTILGAWFLGPLAYQVEWFWTFVPTYVIAPPLVYAAIGRRWAWASITNALVVIVGGLILKSSVGVGVALGKYLFSALISSLLIMGIAMISEKQLQKVMF